MGVSGADTTENLKNFQFICKQKADCANAWM